MAIDRQDEQETVILIGRLHQMDRWRERGLAGVAGAGERLEADAVRTKVKADGLAVEREGFNERGRKILRSLGYRDALPVGIALVQHEIRHAGRLHGSFKRRTLSSRYPWYPADGLRARQALKERRDKLAEGRALSRMRGGEERLRREQRALVLGHGVFNQAGDLGGVGAQACVQQQLFIVPSQRKGEQRQPDHQTGQRPDQRCGKETKGTRSRGGKYWHAASCGNLFTSDETALVAPLEPTDPNGTRTKAMNS